MQQAIDQRRYDRPTLPLYLAALRQAGATHDERLRGLAAYGAGRTYYVLSRLDSAAGLLRLGRASSQRAGDLLLVVNNSNFLNITYAAQGHADSARRVVAGLRALYPHVRPGTAARAKLDDVMSEGWQDQGQYAQAFRHRLAALAYYRQQHDTARIGVGLINLSELFYLQGQARQSLPYRLEGLRWAALAPSLRATMPQLHATLGKTYTELARPDSARRCYETALRLLGPGGATADPDETAALHAALAGVLAELGALAPARRHYRQALAALRGSQSVDVAAQVHYYAGEVELKARNYGLARRHLQRAYALARQIQTLDRYEPIARRLAQAEAGTGHYAEAYRLRCYAAALLDSSHIGEGQRAMAAMEARYQNQDKQRQIGALNAENRLRQAEAAAQRRAKLLALGGVGLLLLVVGLTGFLLRQRQRTAALLAAQNARLAEANQTKAQLFSIISHDLRAPVGSLFQLLEITLDAPELLDEATRRAQTQRLRHSARELLGTMDELLLWSKNQLDRFDPLPETVALPALLAELEALYAPLAQANHIALAVQCPPGLARRTDANFLRIILRNLVQNALKFTPAGGRVWLEAAAGPGAAVVLRVRDTGPGLPPELLAALLDPAAEVSAAAGPGHGLGLRLTQEFVAKLGGELRATSVVGVGSEFVVRV